MPHYNVNIFWSDRDACWIADVPDLKYCSAHGASVAEAAREIEDAMALWLEAAQAGGDALPEPRYRPDLPTHAA
jgi:predicted RNase H-like HicB family nuclease